jgi:hypothetical protein
MKAKADSMLKKGLISEKQHAKMLGSKPKAVIAQAEKPENEDSDDLSARPGKEAKLKGSDTADADDPSGKYRKRGSDTVTHGETIAKGQ